MSWSNRMSATGPMSVRSRRRCRISSWPAANGMSPSSAVPMQTEAPSGTKRAMASRMDMSLGRGTWVSYPRRLRWPGVACFGPVRLCGRTFLFPSTCRHRLPNPRFGLLDCRPVGHDTMMERRTFVTIVAGGLLVAPLAAKAQRSRRIRVGWWAPDSRPDALKWFQQALIELGWVEGGNFAIEQRYARGAAERYAELASDLVRLNVDVLVTDGSPATKAAQRATTTTPIVFVSGDPVAQGFVTSLSSPGGNLTGVAIITGDLNPKRIQLLKEAAPGVTRLAFLE